MKSLLILLIVLFPIILLPTILFCSSDFKPDPAFEHLKKYGKGFDPTYSETHKYKNLQLKKKNFIPKKKW